MAHDWIGCVHRSATSHDHGGATLSLPCSAPAIDYDAARRQIREEIPTKVKDVHRYIGQMRTAEAAAKDTVNMCAISEYFGRASTAQWQSSHVAGSTRDVDESMLAGKVRSKHLWMFVHRISLRSSRTALLAHTHSWSGDVGVVAPIHYPREGSRNARLCRNLITARIMAPRARVLVACLMAWVLMNVEATPKVDYADVRKQVSHAFAERAHEMSATLAVLQGVSKATAAEIKAVQARCGLSA